MKTKIEELVDAVYSLIPDRLELRNDAVNAKPIEVDWTKIDLDDTFEAYAEALKCETCNEVVVVHGIVYSDEHRHLVSDSNCPRCDGEGRHDIRPDTDDAKRAADELDEGEEGDGTVECALCEGTGNVTCTGTLTAEGPMMNYLYPCNWQDMDEAAKAIVDLPLMVVDHPEHGHGLALTGGGMDLSWEISAAYIACGFFPPAHFVSRLPDMGSCHVRQEVIDAAKVSLLLQAAWALRGAQDVEALPEKIRQREVDYKERKERWARQRAEEAKGL